jgi:hypothetical protein
MGRGAAGRRPILWGAALAIVLVAAALCFRAFTDNVVRPDCRGKPQFCVYE